MACSNPAQDGRRGVRLVWTVPASLDRKHIREYIAQDNPIAAIALDDQFADNARRLVDYPGLGRPGRMPGTRELIAHHNYILVYDVAGEAVRILRVLHARRQWPPSVATGD